VKTFESHKQSEPHDGFLFNPPSLSFSLCTDSQKQRERKKGGDSLQLAQCVSVLSDLRSGIINIIFLWNLFQGYLFMEIIFPGK
jgi:hypothetical protein